MPVTQENRHLAISTPLGGDTLLITAFRGDEGISRLFRYEAELLSLDDSIDFHELIGKNVTVTIRLSDDSVRYFNGIVATMAQAGAGRRFVAYRATIVPWLWLLTQRADCRIFQDKSVPEIIEEVFASLDLQDYEMNVSGVDEPREYCVQYRETDCDFICRLMEEEGIFYYFKHEDGRHQMVIANDSSVHEAVDEESPEIRCDLSGRANVEGDVITDWLVRKKLGTGRVSLVDYNFEDPMLDLLVSGDRQWEGSDIGGLEWYEYHPGKYKGTQRGEDYVRLRVEEAEAAGTQITGKSNHRAMASGYKFDLAGHYRSDFEGQTYVITSIQHDAVEPSSFESSTTDQSRDRFYENTFSCIQHEIPFRPRRVTPRPVIQGPQTGIVVGPKGEEIHVDSYGRIKVLFPWDREGKGDETSSCWIRVAQNMAGKGWGGVVIPRIGQEVVIDFLEGDPDRPLVRGCVYNAQSMPPYELPGEMTKTVFKSSSSKGGEGFNELRFEDKAGEEQIFIHGQYNMDVRVLNDVYEWVGNQHHLIVKADEKISIENNREEKVANDQVEEIGKDRHLAVSGKEAKKVTESLSLTVEGDVIEVFNGAHSEETSGDLYLKASGIVIEASSGITIKSGSSSVVLDSSGVTINGSSITLDGSTVKIVSGPGTSASEGSAGSAVTPMAFSDIFEADEADPGTMAEIKTLEKETGTGKYGSAPAIPFRAGQSSEEDEEEEEKTWIEIELLDEEGNPVPGEKYLVTLPNGETASGSLDQNGFARVEGIDPGTCEVTFPNLDESAWEKS